MINIEKKGYTYHDTARPRRVRRFRVGTKFLGGIRARARRRTVGRRGIANTSISGLVSFIGARGVVHRDMIDVVLRIERVRVSVCELAFVLNTAQGSAAAKGVLYVCIYNIILFRTRTHMYSTTQWEN